uniref:Homing endonuclease LAGLIDADG domain-containing protein n=1 Tax=Orbilia brochopaga TaxID=3140254 RepID=A0A4Y5MV30_9PEZI|nr:hypothetical protein [Drechslerella brochopaga]
MFFIHLNILKNSKRSYSSLTNPLDNSLSNLNPWYFTGFSDGESNFTVRISQKNSTNIGWVVQPVFQICLHKKDFNLLEEIRTFLGVGEIYNHQKESCNYVVQSLKGIKVIVDHFKKYPLLTKKREDFELFAQIVTLIEKKEHLTLSGLHEIISLKASMNLGLPSYLKIAFPDITPAMRPKRSDEELLNSNIDPNWMVGFTAGEGCFSIRITEIKAVKVGYQVQLRFNITQHSKDKALIDSFVKFWGCGKVYSRSKENKVDFQIIKFNDLCDKVVPLFQRIPIQGEKSKDFSDFCKAIEIMKTKEHLTNKGLDKIRKLKMGMNKGRK